MWYLGLDAKKIEAAQGAAQNNGYDDESGSYIKVCSLRDFKTKQNSKKNYIIFRNFVSKNNVILFRILLSFCNPLMDRHL